MLSRRRFLSLLGAAAPVAAAAPTYFFAPRGGWLPRPTFTIGQWTDSYPVVAGRRHGKTAAGADLLRRFDYKRLGPTPRDPAGMIGGVIWPQSNPQAIHLVSDLDAALHSLTGGVGAPENGNYLDHGHVLAVPGPLYREPDPGLYVDRGIVLTLSERSILDHGNGYRGAGRRTEKAG